MPNVVVVVSAKGAIMGRANRFTNGTLAVPIDQAERSAARAGFYESLAGKSPPHMKAYWAKVIFTGRRQPPKEVTDSIEMRARVASDSEAIGYMDASFLDDGVRALP